MQLRASPWPCSRGPEWDWAEQPSKIAAARPNQGRTARGEPRRSTTPALLLLQDHGVADADPLGLSTRPQCQLKQALWIVPQRA